jgi:tripartite-type tricarboxylate transporter receptor subunit TctC
MTVTRRAAAVCAAAALAATCVAVPAFAQTYPDKPIRLIVSAAPGGVTDLLARALATEVSQSFGQQIIVENKPGANNQIAAEYVAKAPPDGATLLVTPEVTFVINPHLYKKLSYDPVKDFSPVAGLVSVKSLVRPFPRTRSRTCSRWPRAGPLS